MKKLSESYKEIKPSIVAIVSKNIEDPQFPTIIGTGFIVRSDGIVLTNRHIIKAIKKIPRKKDSPPDSWPAFVLMFNFIPNKGMALIPLEIKGVILTSKIKQQTYYGQDYPDLGIIRVNVNGLHPIRIENKFGINEGDEVAVCGFPMGTSSLKAPGWIHQLTPILQKGIVSAILPFECQNPHAFMIDIVSEGGASGSPVFNIETGNVIGMLYGGLYDNKILQDNDGLLIYKNSTSHTLAIPCSYLNYTLNEIDKIKDFKEHKIEFINLETLIKESKIDVVGPKRNMFKRYD